MIQLAEEVIDLANIKSSIKRIKINAKRNQRNRHIKATVRTAVRGFQEALVNGDDAEQQLRLAIRRIDRAANKGVLHKNAAARKKSRLTKQLNRMQAAAQE